MPDTKELVQKIEGIWEQMKAKNDEVIAQAGEFKNFREEDKAFLAKMNADLDATKKQLDELAVEVRRKGVVLPGDQKFEDEETKARKAAFYKYVRQGRKEMGPDERKALVEDTTGLYLVPEDLESEIVRAIPQLNPLRAACRVRPTSRDKVRKRTLTEVSVGWGKLETGTAITETTLVPADDNIYVEDLYGLTKIGEDELEDTDANLQAILADSFSVALADEEAKRFAIGLGHTTYQQPAGVAVDATIIASYKANWTTADTAATEDVLTCEYTLPAQYRKGASWLMNGATELALRLLRAEVASGYYGNYLWQPSLVAGAPNNFDGYPIMNQDDMNYPADATAGINVLFGNFKLGYMILERRGMSIQRLDELYAESGLIGFKCRRRVGGGVYRARAFQGIYNNT